MFKGSLLDKEDDLEELDEELGKDEENGAA